VIFLCIPESGSISNHKFIRQMNQTANKMLHMHTPINTNPLERFLISSDIQSKK